MLALDGVVAAVLPEAPQRSLLNGGTYEDVRGLRTALPVLADAYDRAGVRASTIWIVERNPEAVAVLEENAYVLDGEPAAMHLELTDLTEPDLEGLDWDDGAAPKEVALVNDLAYGYPEGEGLGSGIGAGPPGMGIRSYRARVGGELACVLQTLDIGSDCLIMWVATLPEYRGQRLASRLLSAALIEARSRGVRSSSLQSSMLGRGVYERLGYELVFQLGLYERRV